MMVAGVIVLTPATIIYEMIFVVISDSSLLLPLYRRFAVIGNQRQKHEGACVYR